jgi:hypothetical protein
MRRQLVKAGNGLSEIRGINDDIDANLADVAEEGDVTARLSNGERLTGQRSQRRKRKRDGGTG